MGAHHIQHRSILGRRAVDLGDAVARHQDTHAVGLIATGDGHMRRGVEETDGERSKKVVRCRVGTRK